MVVFTYIGCQATMAAMSRPARRRRRVPRPYVRGEERRASILEAAAALFAQHGFAGTTTRRIAAAAGTTETVLFRHFPTKDGLYASILERQGPLAAVEQWLGDLRELAARRDDEALFRAIARGVLESYRRNLAYHRLMLFAALEDHDIGRLAQTKYAAPVASFLRGYIARRQAEGAFRRGRPDFIVHTLFSSLIQFGQAKALGTDPLRLTEAEIETQAVELMTAWRGIR
jgi:TetR/AcrR family transcriptional regulator